MFRRISADSVCGARSMSFMGVPLRSTCPEAARTCRSGKVPVRMDSYQLLRPRESYAAQKSLRFGGSRRRRVPACQVADALDGHVRRRIGGQLRRIERVMALACKDRREPLVPDLL